MIVVFLLLLRPNMVVVQLYVFQSFFFIYCYLFGYFKKKMLPPIYLPTISKRATRFSFFKEQKKKKTNAKRKSKMADRSEEKGRRSLLMNIIKLPVPTTAATTHRLRCRIAENGNEMFRVKTQNIY